jgi:perosamine synthetase
MCPADAARKWTPRTKLLVPVHFGGHPCDMDALQALAASHGTPMMEDAAHALPASYRGRKIGSLSRLTVFSFYATKNLATGEGGMVTTADAELADRIRQRRLHGMTRDAWKRLQRCRQLALRRLLPGLQVQHDRHQRRPRAGPAPSARRDAGRNAAAS